MRLAIAWLLIGGIAVGCGPTQRIDPEASDKRYLLAADYFEKRMLRPALEELQKTLDLNPQNPDAHNLAGLIHLSQAAESEQMIERATCVAGDEAKLERHEIDEHFRQAEEAFRRALQFKPDFSDAWNNLAVVAIHFQRWDEAIAASEKALSNPLYRAPWAAQGNLGWAYLQKKEFARAAKELRTALFSNPQFCVGRYRLAKVYYDQQRWDQATEELDKVTSDKACPIQEAFLLDGLTSLRRNDREHAQAMFRRCIELGPQSCLAKQCRIAE